MPWPFIALAAALVAAGALALYLTRAGRRVVRRRLNRAAIRSLRRFRSRVNRFKLTGKPYIKAALLGDEQIATAVRQHAIENHMPKEQVWTRVESYIDEIVPFFNIIFYYRVGYVVSRALLNLFYRVSVEESNPAALARLPRSAIVVYLLNHRSNADYVLAGYALSGRVAISYAVGEWARAFPLEYIFKSFGAYFIRRRFREPLYHTVLERYVQLITRNGVTQGIFPEGGLSRDGRLQHAKIGLFDYILGVARDPAYRARLFVVPVAINYDRVIEDRTLLRELETRSGGARVSRVTQAGEVTRYVSWNLGRLLSRRWKRYGRAAVVIGEPVSLAPWLDAQDRTGAPLFDLPRSERLARVQVLCDEMMARIGAIIPVTPVPLACAAIQSFEADFISRRRLLDRMAEMRDVLLELNGRVIRSEGAIEEIFDRAWRMLQMRRILSESGEGFAVLPRGRPLVSYYANSIAHLLGPFERGVRERDALLIDGRG